ncbi:MAG TPA: hypothetical protein VN429_04985 [Methanospirillum sp.]|uniref:hypothetical protein n=1 Tax=Methanospirillum sp. TaxID=45200 RepID=UPI002C0C830A|nr:hypothetical protein [Methanospirillum sp.]HWQ63750.1 hypothetical protein [Methanospirillum sp.]
MSPISFALLIGMMISKVPAWQSMHQPDPPSIPIGRIWDLDIISATWSDSREGIGVDISIDVVVW